jgi:hypothetical protein
MFAPPPPADIQSKARIINIEAILSERNLPRWTALPALKYPIGEHASFCFHHIYQHPYLKSSPSIKPSHIPRPLHGIAHVSRVAIYIEILSKLYSQYGLLGIEHLTPEKIHLLKIAALFHDAARMDDGEDLWDRESAVMAFHYLLQLDCTEQEAKLIAEVIANKDYEPGGTYYSLESTHIPIKVIPTEESTVLSAVNYYWHNKISSHPKSLLQKILHDADCLDIIRAKTIFNSQFLHLYREGDLNNPQRISDLKTLVSEIKQLIYECGDDFRQAQHSWTAIQKNYHFEYAYTLILQTRILAYDTALTWIKDLHELPLQKVTLIPLPPPSLKSEIEYELIKRIHFDIDPHSSYFKNPVDHWNGTVHAFTKDTADTPETNPLAFWPLRVHRQLDPQAPMTIGVNRDLHVGRRKLIKEENTEHWHHEFPRYTAEEKAGFSKKTALSLVCRKNTIARPYLFSFPRKNAPGQRPSMPFLVGIIFSGREGISLATDSLEREEV